MKTRKNKIKQKGGLTETCSTSEKICRSITKSNLTELNIPTPYLYSNTYLIPDLSGYLASYKYLLAIGHLYNSNSETPLNYEGLSFKRMQWDNMMYNKMWIKQLFKNYESIGFSNGSFLNPLLLNNQETPLVNIFTNEENVEGAPNRKYKSWEISSETPDLQWVSLDFEPASFVDQSTLTPANYEGFFFENIQDYKETYFKTTSNWLNSYTPRGNERHKLIEKYLQYNGIFDAEKHFRLNEDVRTCLDNEFYKLKTPGTRENSMSFDENTLDNFEKECRAYQNELENIPLPIDYNKLERDLSESRKNLRTQILTQDNLLKAAIKKTDVLQYFFVYYKVEDGADDDNPFKVKVTIDETIKSNRFLKKENESELKTFLENPEFEDKFLHYIKRAQDAWEKEKSLPFTKFEDSCKCGLAEDPPEECDTEKQDRTIVDCKLSIKDFFLYNSKIPNSEKKQWFELIKNRPCFTTDNPIVDRLKFLLFEAAKRRPKENSLPSYFLQDTLGNFVNGVFMDNPNYNGKPTEGFWSCYQSLALIFDYKVEIFPCQEPIMCLDTDLKLKYEKTVASETVAAQDEDQIFKAYAELLGYLNWALNNPTQESRERLLYREATWPEIIPSKQRKATTGHPSLEWLNFDFIKQPWEHPFITQSLNIEAKCTNKTNCYNYIDKSITSLYIEQVYSYKSQKESIPIDISAVITTEKSKTLSILVEEILNTIFKRKKTHYEYLLHKISLQQKQLCSDISGNLCEKINILENIKQTIRKELDSNELDELTYRKACSAATMDRNPDGVKKTLINLIEDILSSCKNIVDKIKKIISLQTDTDSFYEYEYLFNLENTQLQKIVHLEDKDPFERLIAIDEIFFTSFGYNQLRNVMYLCGSKIADTIINNKEGEKAQCIKLLQLLIKSSESRTKNTPREIEFIVSIVSKLHFFIQNVSKQTTVKPLRKKSRTTTKFNSKYCPPSFSSNCDKFRYLPGDNIGIMDKILANDYDLYTAEKLSNGLIARKFPKFEDLLDLLDPKMLLASDPENVKNGVKLFNWLCYKKHNKPKPFYEGFNNIDEKEMNICEARNAEYIKSEKDSISARKTAAWGLTILTEGATIVAQYLSGTSPLIILFRFIFEYVSPLLLDLLQQKIDSEIKKTDTKSMSGGSTIKSDDYPIVKTIGEWLSLKTDGNLIFRLDEESLRILQEDLEFYEKYEKATKKTLEELDVTTILPAKSKDALMQKIINLRIEFLDSRLLWVGGTPHFRYDYNNNTQSPLVQLQQAKEKNQLDKIKQLKSFMKADTDWNKRVCEATQIRNTKDTWFGDSIEEEFLQKLSCATEIYSAMDFKEDPSSPSPKNLLGQLFEKSVEFMELEKSNEQLMYEQTLKKGDMKKRWYAFTQAWSKIKALRTFVLKILTKYINDNLTENLGSTWYTELRDFLKKMGTTQINILLKDLSEDKMIKYPNFYKLINTIIRKINEMFQANELRKLTYILTNTSHIPLDRCLLFERLTRAKLSNNDAALRIIIDSYNIAANEKISDILKNLLADLESKSSPKFPQYIFAKVESYPEVGKTDPDLSVYIDNIIDKFALSHGNNTNLEISKDVNEKLEEEQRAIKEIIELQIKRNGTKNRKEAIDLYMSQTDEAPSLSLQYEYDFLTQNYTFSRTFIPMFKINTFEKILQSGGASAPRLPIEPIIKAENKSVIPYLETFVDYGMSNVTVNALTCNWLYGPELKDIASIVIMNKMNIGSSSLLNNSENFIEIPHEIVNFLDYTEFLNNRKLLGMSESIRKKIEEIRKQTNFYSVEKGFIELDWEPRKLTLFERFEESIGISTISPIAFNTSLSQNPPQINSVIILNEISNLINSIDEKNLNKPSRAFKKALQLSGGLLTKEEKIYKMTQRLYLLHQNFLYISKGIEEKINDLVKSFRSFTKSNNWEIPEAHVFDDAIKYIIQRCDIIGSDNIWWEKDKRPKDKLMDISPYREIEIMLNLYINEIENGKLQKDIVLVDFKLDTICNYLSEKYSTCTKDDYINIKRDYKAYVIMTHFDPLNPDSEYYISTAKLAKIMESYNELPEKTHESMANNNPPIKSRALWANKDRTKFGNPIENSSHVLYIETGVAGPMRIYEDAIVDKTFGERAPTNKPKDFFVYLADVIYMVDEDMTKTLIKSPIDNYSWSKDSVFNHKSEQNKKFIDTYLKTRVFLEHSHIRHHVHHYEYELYNLLVQKGPNELNYESFLLEPKIMTTPYNIFLTKKAEELYKKNIDLYFIDKINEANGTSRQIDEDAQSIYNYLFNKSSTQEVLPSKYKTLIQDGFTDKNPTVIKPFMKLSPYSYLAQLYYMLQKYDNIIDNIRGNYEIYNSINPNKKYDDLSKYDKIRIINGNKYYSNDSRYSIDISNNKYFVISNKPSNFDKESIKRSLTEEQPYYLTNHLNLHYENIGFPGSAIKPPRGGRKTKKTRKLVKN